MFSSIKAYNLVHADVYFCYQVPWAIYYTSKCSPQQNWSLHFSQVSRAKMSHSVWRIWEAYMKPKLHSRQMPYRAWCAILSGHDARYTQVCSRPGWITMFTPSSNCKALPHPQHKLYSIAHSCWNQDSYLQELLGAQMLCRIHSFTPPCIKM